MFESMHFVGLALEIIQKDAELVEKGCTGRILRTHKGFTARHRHAMPRIANQPEPRFFLFSPVAARQPKVNGIKTKNKKKQRNRQLSPLWAGTARC